MIALIFSVRKVMKSGSLTEMPKMLFFILSIYLSEVGADDLYHLSFDEKIEFVSVQVCFDGEPPRYLYRNSQSNRFTEWVRAGDRNIGHRGERHLSLKGLEAGSCVSWRVNLARAASHGDYRLALQLEDAVLMPADLWFWRDDERRPLRVKVDLPEGVSLSVPWKEQIAASGQQFYVPEQTPASWSSKVAVGSFTIDQIPVGGTRLRLAIIGVPGQDKRRDLAAWIRESAASVASVYGRYPQLQPQVLIASVGKQTSPVPWAHIIRGGGAAVEFFIDHHRSLSEFRADWTATHEMSHMLLPYVSRRDRWLSEGLASYYQNVLRARDGRLTEEQAWRRLNDGFERGRKATRGGSLASATRSGRGATMRIYWSGAAIMLKADAQLRALSNGRQSLDTALEGLHGCCFEEGKTWKAKELLAELDVLTGFEVFSGLYEEHVPDEEFPDVEALYARLGVVAANGSISLEPAAPWENIRQFIMNDHSVSTGGSGNR